MLLSSNWFHQSVECYTLTHFHTIENIWPGLQEHSQWSYHNASNMELHYKTLESKLSVKCLE